jgi:hypothetical protein
MILIIVILTSLQIVFSKDSVNISTEEIDYALIGVGATRLVFLDAPIVFIFIS